MSIQSRLEAATQVAEEASSILRQVANGGPDVSVPTLSGTVPSLLKWFATIKDEIEQAAALLAAAALYNDLPEVARTGSPGEGGGGGGGASHTQGGGGGGGVDLYGIGPSGAGGTSSDAAGGGSGGENGGRTGNESGRGTGGKCGGGGTGARGTVVTVDRRGGNGGVRIIWGRGRSFPHKAADV